MQYAERIRRDIHRLGSNAEVSAEAIARSEKLHRQLKQRLSVQPLPFRDVMEQLLYAPHLGYYCAQTPKIGAAGDFITAPEISPLFGFALAQQCAQVLRVTGGSILEFGAGLGTLAKDILLQLEAANCVPEKYFIIEISEDLKRRQENFLQQEIPHLYAKIEWLDAVPDDGFTGVILANEVIDAMPVHQFEITSLGATESQVAIGEQGELVVQQSTQLSAKLEQWFARDAIQQINFAANYTSEVNLDMESWIEALAKSLQQGLILIVDYGYPRAEYYRPERNRGTLLCYFRHHSHEHLVSLPGLQDITSHVDFTAVAEAARTTGLSVSGYTKQANFLNGCGILQKAEQVAAIDLDKQIEVSRQMKTLLMPEHMGERFKVMALAQNLADGLSSKLIGFSFSDQRHHL